MPFLRFHNAEMLLSVKKRGFIDALHRMWHLKGYVPSCYRIYDFSSDNRFLVRLLLFYHILIIVFYSLPLFWLYFTFNLWTFSFADRLIWGEWLGLTLLLMYRAIPLYLDAWHKKKIVIRATYKGYKRVRTLSKYDFKTLVFDTGHGKIVDIKPYWPREQDIVANFLGDAEKEHPVYIEKTGCQDLLLNVRSDWKAIERGEKPC